MIRIFHRSREEWPHRSGKKHTCCPYCTALKQAREHGLFDVLPECNSPLTPGIQASNLSVSSNGNQLYAALDLSLRPMLSGLPAVGTGLVMTRNSSAIIGRSAPYPELTFTANHSKAIADGAQLIVHPRRFALARACHEQREAGHILWVEFMGGDEETVHRFILTKESDLGEFLGWVRLHQKCASAENEEPVVCQEPQPEQPFHDKREFCEGNASALGRLMQTLMNRRSSFRVRVTGGGATQQEELAPMEVRLAGGWWTVRDRHACLHFHSDLRIRFESPNIDQPNLLNISAGDSDGRLKLLLYPGEKTTASNWRAHLRSIVPFLHL